MLNVNCMLPFEKVSMKACQRLLLPESAVVVTLWSDTFPTGEDVDILQQTILSFPHTPQTVAVTFVFSTT